MSVKSLSETREAVYDCLFDELQDSTHSKEMEKAIADYTSDRMKTVVQTSTSAEVHFTRAFMEPNEKLANSIQATAVLGESSSFMWELAPTFFRVLM